MPDPRSENSKLDLSDDEQFVDSREMLMRVIGVFLIRSGGTLTVSCDEMNSMDDQTIGFNVDHDGNLEFYLTTVEDKAN